MQPEISGGTEGRRPEFLELRALLPVDLST